MQYVFPFIKIWTAIMTFLRQKLLSLQEIQISILFVMITCIHLNMDFINLQTRYIVLF